MRTVIRAIFFGLVFCLIQVTVAVFLAPKGNTLKDSYLRLNQWDSVHYADIAAHGYRMPDKPPTPADVHSGAASVAFFPAYPLMARWVSGIFDISAGIALLLTSQFFCWVFWVYFFLLLEGWGVPRRRGLFAGATIAVHPAAFFLVAGYSESLFLAAILGFIFWTEKWVRQRQAVTEGPMSVGTWWFAALHGVAMTGTRLFGLPLVIYPLVRSVVRRLSAQAIGLAIVSTMGCVLFFYWNHIHFGQWDLYLKLQKLGWGNDPYYLALIDPRSYIPHFFFEDTNDSITRLSVPFTVILFVISFRVEYRMAQVKGSRAWMERLGLYCLAFLLFYLPLAGKANAKMDSMIRYTFPAFVLLVLALVQMTGSVTRRRWVMGLGYTLALAVQIWMMFRFLKGGWVA